MRGDLSRTALLTNAAFSGIGGLAVLVAPGLIAEEVALAEATWVLRLLGAGLLVFATAVATVGRQARPPAAQVQVISAMDAVWVVASVVVLLAGIGGLTTAGAWIIGLTAEAVALFGVAQLYGLRRRREAPRPGVPVT